MLLCMPARTGIAHVVTTTRKYKDQVYTTHLLRRSYRVGPAKRNRAIHNPGSGTAHAASMHRIRRPSRVPDKTVRFVILGSKVDARVVEPGGAFGGRN